MKFKLTYFKADGTTQSGVVDDDTIFHWDDALRAFTAANNIAVKDGDEFRVSLRVITRPNFVKSSQD